jgi:hypothetical protein
MGFSPLQSEGEKRLLCLYLRVARFCLLAAPELLSLVSVTAGTRPAFVKASIRESNEMAASRHRVMSGSTADSAGENFQMTTFVGARRSCHKKAKSEGCKSVVLCTSAPVLDVCLLNFRAFCLSTRDPGLRLGNAALHTE